MAECKKLMDSLRGDLDGFMSKKPELLLLKGAEYDINGGREKSSIEVILSLRVLQE